MTPRFSFIIDGRRYSFVDTYSDNDYPLPGDHVTYPIFSGMRSSCVANRCTNCLFYKAAQLHTSSCRLPLIDSPHITAVIPDHIKQSFPEYFI